MDIYKCSYFCLHFLKIWEAQNNILAIAFFVNRQIALKHRYAIFYPNFKQVTNFCIKFAEINYSELVALSFNGLQHK